MLTHDILTALKSYTANIQKSVGFVLQSGDHPKRPELVKFLRDIAGVSEKITFSERFTALRSPITFALEADGLDTGIRFSGIPGGHEFNSLVLALLQAGGAPIKLDAHIKERVAAIEETLAFEVFVSLSCHNCPDVVQALNQFALLNPRVQVEMIDGGLFKEVIDARDIQGVPTVYLNGELFASGKVTAAELVQKLIARYPVTGQRPATKEMPLQDVTVIGGGPAGVSAAIYSARKGLKVTLIADRIGGQVKDTMDIENLISVTKTTGPQLSRALQAHMDEYEVTVKEHLKVTRVENGDIKTLVLSSGEIIPTKTIIIATGAKWRELGVPGEKENIGSGVAYCPHCDGPFFKGKDVAVVGGGNSGIEAALDLAGIVKSVTVLEFNADLKADKILVDKAYGTSNITIVKNAATQAVLAENGKVIGLKYKNRVTEQEHQLKLDGVFVQIGLIPNSDFLGGLVERNRFGEILINERGETSVKGIFAAGDVTTVPYKQIVVSVGEGAKASLASFEYLLKEGDHLTAMHYQNQLKATSKVA